MLSANYKKLIKYIVAGGSTFAFEYIVFICSYYIVKTNILVSITLGYTIALSYNFIINRYWVFKSNSFNNKYKAQMLMYILLLVANYFLNIFITTSLINQFRFQPYLSKLISTTIIAIWNFLIYNKIIFKERSSDE